MSQKNSEGKRTARERLRAEQERHRAAQKRRRTLKVSAVVVGVLVVGAAAAVTVASRSDSGGGEDKQSAKPITVGKASAPAKLTVYEDFRCPACGQFEKQFASTVQGLEKAGKLRAEYHLVTLIDGNMGGSGSKKAANAAACARDEGKFTQYHDELFDKQPAEQEDAFASKQRLIDLADRVDGLPGASFEKCVKDGKHDAWVEESNDAFANSKHNSTPTILLDGKDVYADQSDPLTPGKLKKKVEARN